MELHESQPELGWIMPGLRVKGLSLKGSMGQHKQHQRAGIFGRCVARTIIPSPEVEFLRERGSRLNKGLFGDNLP